MCAVVTSKKISAFDGILNHNIYLFKQTQILNIHIVLVVLHKILLSTAGSQRIFLVVFYSRHIIHDNEFKNIPSEFKNSRNNFSKFVIFQNIFGILQIFKEYLFEFQKIF